MGKAIRYKLNTISEIAISEYENKDPNILAASFDDQITWPIRLVDAARVLRRMSNALLVIVNTPEIQAFLRDNDPKALQQCLDALHAETVPGEIEDYG